MNSTVVMNSSLIMSSKVILSQPSEDGALENRPQEVKSNSFVDDSASLVIALE